MILFDFLTRHKRNKGAFSGPLNCPYCQHPAQDFVEKLNPYRFRYRCKKCKFYYQYDISGLKDHPYKPIKTPTFQEILESSKSGKSQRRNK